MSTEQLIFFVAALVLVLIYLPIAVMQDWLLIRNRKVMRRICTHANVNQGSRKVLCVIATNGKNPMVVEHIIGVVRSYFLPVEIFVIKEERDHFKYSCNEITVPQDYTTPNSTKYKMRALQFGIEKLHEAGYGEDTYICHLDDDSIPTYDYLEHLFSMEEEAGQGHIRLRKAGIHMLSTLADMARVSNCDSFCQFFNSIGRPKSVHGEGLVIRADVEYRIGWDFGTYGCDDLIMGQLIIKNGYRFGHIPHAIMIAPPVSARDFYKQRRRWIMSVLWAHGKLNEIDRRATSWFMYRYAAGWTGITGLMLAVLGLVYGLYIPVPLAMLLGFNILSYFLFYQYGTVKTSKKYMLSMALLQLPVAIYEGGTLIYSLLFPPHRDSFDVITKV
ncbi:MAG: glycosyltransferase family 2 protein [Methanomassiliicoccales archaeon]